MSIGVLDPGYTAHPGAERAFEARCEVRLNAPVAGDYRLLTLAAPAEILACRPGQFFHLLCPVRDGLAPFLRRPMSIYGWDRDRGELYFLYKIAGTGTGALAALAPGETLDVLGPLGNGFYLAPEWRRLLLLARGVGLATLAPLAQEAQRTGRALTAICSARSPDHLMSVDRFRALGAEVIPVTDTDGTSAPAHLRGLIEARIAGDGIDAVFTCGSNRLLALLQDLGARHAIPGRIALEQQMACGLGMCQCCVRSFRRDGAIVHARVCNEGPVFDIQEAMEW